jgi:hypothetical protein
VYVPLGVPGVVCEDEPPQPRSEANVNAIVDAASTGSLRRWYTNKNPEPNKINVHANGKLPGGKFAREIVPVVTGPVVATMTATRVGVPVVTWIELGRLQVGAGFSVGSILQLKLTVPLNEPAGVTAKLNVAF